MFYSDIYLLSYFVSHILLIALVMVHANAFRREECTRTFMQVELRVRGRKQGVLGRVLGGKDECRGWA